MHNLYLFVVVLEFESDKSDIGKIEDKDYLSRTMIHWFPVLDDHELNFCWTCYPKLDSREL